MKWFKHMTATFDDERIAALVGKGGESGLALYGAFWRVAEIVAAQMGKDGSVCSVKYPLWRWAQFLLTRPAYARSILVRLQVEGLLKLEGDLNSDLPVVVSMPNLLKYRDEYSKKSGHATDNVTARTEKETEQRKKQNKTEKRIIPTAPPSGDESKRVVLPEWISREAWDGFLEMRSRKRVPNTNRALEGIIRELEKLRERGQDPTAVLDQSTMRGYTGVFEVKGSATADWSLFEDGAQKRDPLAGMTFANAKQQGKGGRIISAAQEAIHGLSRASEGDITGTTIGNEFFDGLLKPIGTEKQLGPGATERK